MGTEPANWRKKLIDKNLLLKYNPEFDSKTAKNPLDRLE